MPAVGAVNIRLGAVTTDFLAAMNGAGKATGQFVAEYKSQFGKLAGSVDAPKGAFTALNRTLSQTKKQIQDVLSVGGKVPADLLKQYNLLKGAADSVFKGFNPEAPIRSFQALSQKLSEVRAKIEDTAASGKKVNPALIKQYEDLKSRVEAVNSVFKPTQTIGAFESLNRKLTETKGKIEDLVASGKQISPALMSQYNGLKAQVESVNNAFVSPKVITFGERLQNIGNIAQSTGRSLTTYLTAPIALLSGASFKAYADISATIQGFKALDGSIAEARNDFNTFREIAKLPGLGLEEAEQAGLRMESLGYSTLKAKDYLLQFGNAIALGGGGRTQFDSILTQITQMSSKSKVLAEDLKPIVNASPVIAKAVRELFGSVDSEQISAQLQKQGKGPADFLDTLVAKLGQLERVTGGPKNAAENLTDSLKVAGFMFGEAADKAFGLTDSLTGLGDGITSAAEGFAGLDPALQKVILGTIGIAAAIGPLTLAVGSAAKLVPTLTKGWELLGIAFTSTAGVIAAAVAVVGVMGYALYDFNKAVDSSVDKGKLLADVQTEVSKAVKGESDKLRELTAIAEDEHVGKEKRLAAIRQINQIAPDYLGNIDLESFKTGQATKEIEKYIQVLALKTKAQRLAERFDQASESYDQTYAQNPKDFLKVTDYLGAGTSALTGTYGSALALKAGERQKAELDKATQQMAIIEDEQKKLIADAKKLGVDLSAGLGTSSTGGANGFSSEFELAADRAKALKSQIEALAYANPKNPKIAELRKEYDQLTQRIQAAQVAAGKKIAAPKTEKTYLGKELSANERAIKEFQSSNPGVEIPVSLRFRNAELKGNLGKAQTFVKSALPPAEEMKGAFTDYWRAVANGMATPLQQAFSQLKADIPKMLGDVRAAINNALSRTGQIEDVARGLVPVDQLQQGIAMLVSTYRGGMAEFNRVQEKLMDISPDKRGQMLQGWLDMTDQINGALQGAAGAAAVGMGELIGGLIAGAQGLASLPAIFGGILGDLAQQIGKAMIAFGTSGIALQTFISNPVTALVAGVGLVALGAALKAKIGKSVKNVKGYAKGGVFGGESLIRVAEYGDAASNPEIVGKLSDFKAMIRPVVAQTVANSLQTYRPQVNSPNNGGLGGLPNLQIEVKGMLRGQDVHMSGQRYQKSIYDFR